MMQHDEFSHLGKLAENQFDQFLQAHIANIQVSLYSVLGKEKRQQIQLN